MKVVRIKFLDHYSERVDEDRVDKLRKVWIEEVGWLLKEDNDHVFIVNRRYSGEGDTRGELVVGAVLKKQIIEMKEIGED